MNWGDEKVRIKRFLRDPVGNIWNDNLLLRIYNDAQREIQQKTKILEDVRSVSLPPIFDWSYLHDWEYAFFPKDHGPSYQAFNYDQAEEYVISYPWESQIAASLDVDFTDGDGYHFTHPWEGFVVLPGDIIPLRLPEGFYEAIFTSWDEGAIEPIDKKSISRNDSTWKTRQGEPVGYWRPDVTEPYFVLYPQPSSVTWADDLPTAINEPTWAVSQEWENSSIYISTATGTQFTKIDADNELTFVFDWEYLMPRGATFSTNDPIRAMWSWEVDESIIGDNTGTARLTDGREFSTGSVLSYVYDFYGTDQSIESAAIDTEDTVLFIYRQEPTEIKTITDIGLFPDYLKKYVEYAALERSYAADNDGQNETLRDYWGQRKTLGIEIIKKFMSRKKVDRDYRLTTRGAGINRNRRHPVLPDNYPVS
jgi:hypothetical protein